MMRLSLPLLLILAVPAQGEVIGTMQSAPPLTRARIDQLPAAERTAWIAYLDRSARTLAADKAALVAERQGMATPPPGPDAGSSGSGMPMNRPAAWYGSAEARRIADTIVSFQTPAGGWGKNQNRSAPPRRRGQSYVVIENLPAYAKSDIEAIDQSWRYVGTIDNDATLMEIRFLARVQSQVPGAEGAAYRAAALKGLSYLLGAQLPNGGWPQVYPLQGGYHDAITFNDSALSGTATLMLDAATREGDFAFVPADVAQAAAQSARKARDVILKSQVIVAGKRTIWGQQHDAFTLAPVGARNFEPAALSSAESSDLIQFLMKQPDRTPEVEQAVRDGAAWLEAHALSGVEWDRAEGRLVEKPGAGPLWSRFYDIHTASPIFGDRDKKIETNVNAISLERRKGYSWFNINPAKTIAAARAWLQR